MIVVTAKDEPLDARITVGVPRTVKSQVKAAAKKAGLSMSAWCLAAITEKLRRG